MLVHLQMLEIFEYYNMNFASFMQLDLPLRSHLPPSQAVRIDCKADIEELQPVKYMLRKKRYQEPIRYISFSEMGTAMAGVCTMLQAMYIVTSIALKGKKVCVFQRS